MECQLTDDLQSGSLVREARMGSITGSMHRESALVSSTWMVPEGIPPPLKSSRSFYRQPSWADSIEEPVASPAPSPFNTPHASRSHLFVVPPSTQSNPYSPSGTESTMMDSSGISSLGSTKSPLPNPSSKEEKKEKGKKTKLGRMYSRASISTKAISRLLFHSPPSGSTAKRPSLKEPLPLAAPPEEDLIVDPFASGKFVASYGLSPVETNAPARLQRNKRATEAEPAETQPLESPPPPDVSNPPLSRNTGQRPSTWGRDIPFPPSIGTPSSTSLPSLAQRTRSISVYATRAAKPFHNPSPMPQLPPTTTAECPLLPGDLLPLPFLVDPPEPLTRPRPRAYSLSETKFRATVQLTKGVPLEDNTRPSSNNDDMRPLPAIPVGANRAVAVQAQTQVTDSDLTVDMRDGRVASEVMMPSLKGNHLKSSLDVSAGSRQLAGNIEKDIDPALEFQTYSTSESLPQPLPPAIASGISERIRRRQGSGSASSEGPSPTPYQQSQSVTKPILPLLSTQNLSPLDNSSDSETLGNDCPQNQRFLPRSPSLPDLRPCFEGAQPIPELKHTQVRGHSEEVHPRSPSLPTLSDVSMPQALPASVVDGLKLRSRSFSRPESRMSSTDSVLSSERVSVRPLARHERKGGKSEFAPTFRFGHAYTSVRPSVPSIQPSASTVQPYSSSTGSQVKRSLRSPSVPDLRARAIASSGNRSQSSSTPTSSPICHVQNQSHPHSILVPPIPPIPDNYKLQASANLKSETPPSSNVNICRPRLNLTRPKEISYPPSRKAEKLLQACFDEELLNEEGMDDDGSGKLLLRIPSSVVGLSSSSMGLERRRTVQKFRSLSMMKEQGQGSGGGGGGGDNVPPVPPLPTSSPSLPPASGMRDGFARGGMVIGAAL